MRWIEATRKAARACLWRVRARLTWRSREAELDEEIQAHVELLTEEHRRRGLSDADARFAALRDFGGREQVREACRDLRRVPVFDSIATDVRYACRTLRRQPVFAAVAVATFALGFGGSTAIYSVINETVLAPLPYANSGRLVWIADAWPAGLGSVMNVEYLVWWEQSRSFSGTAAYTTRQVTLSGAGVAERFVLGTVSTRFFSMLGVRPELGRDFRAEEDESGRERVVLLTDGLWRERFGGAAGVIGRNVFLDGETYLVVGVLPRGFRFLEREQPALFAPYLLPPTRRQSGQSISQVNVIGWLAPGVTAAAAEVELATILQRSKNDYPLSALSYGEARPRPRVVTPAEWRRSRIGPAPFVLAAAVGLLLLIACANIANLQLARCLERRRELAVRAALGAGRLRLIRHLVIESVLLATVGGLAALALAYATLRVARALAPESLAYLRDVQLDSATLAFTSVLVVVAGFASGALPAFVTVPIGLSDSLKVVSHRLTQDRLARNWTTAFSTVTLALAVVLLVGSGLLGRSFVRLTALRYGLEPANLLTLRVGLPNAAYGHRATVRAAAERLVSELGALHGVAACGLSDVGPLGFCRAYSAEVGEPGGNPDQRPTVCEESVSARYLQLLGVDVLRGRLFRDDESGGGAAVAVINDSARRQFFDRGDPIGARLRTRDGWLTVVGVVGDMRTSRSEPGAAALFQLFDQPHSTLMNSAGMYEWARGRPDRRYMAPPTTELTLVLRSQREIDPRALASVVRDRIMRVDPDVAVYDIATMEERLASTVAADRFLLILLAALAGIALTLALVGVYGVTSYGVARRTAEIGVRLTLGASPANVLGLVLVQSVRAAAFAVALGVIGALSLGRFVRALLFETSPNDVLALVGAAAFVLAVVVLAAFLPARRASMVDPAETLRHE